MKKIAAVFLILLLLAGIAAFSVHLWLHRAPPKSVSVLEDALATDDLIAMAYFDNETWATIQDLLAGEEDPSPLSIPGDEGDLFSKLYIGKADFKHNLDQAFLAVRMLDDASANTYLVMHGQFDWASIQQTLASAYRIEGISDYRYQFTQLEKKDDAAYACPASSTAKKAAVKTFFVHVQPDWLILSTRQDALDELLGRIQKRARADLDLSHWREYRSGKLASLAIFSPADSSKAGSGMSAALAAQAAAKNPEVKALYAGIGISYLDAGVLLNLRIESSQEWATDTSASLNKTLQQWQQQAATASPAFAGLLGDINATARDDILDVSLGLDIATLNKTGDMVKEGLAYAFSGGTETAEKLSAEQIDESPWNFAQNRKLLHPGDFDNGHSSATPLFIQGPFAVDLSRASLGKESDLLELDIKAQMQVPEIDGFWFASKADLSLMINSVQGKNAEELMRDERCIDKLPRFAEKNEKPAHGFNTSNLHAYVSKTIRLKAGTSLADIEQINGSIEFTAPGEVQRITLPAAVGESINMEGLRVFISSVKQQSVSYRISGDSDKLIEVRALNKQGKVLQKGFSMSSFDAVTQTFRGDIGKLEFFIATRMAHQKVDFTLAGDALLSSRGQQAQAQAGHQLPAAVSVQEWNQWNSARVADVDPAKLSQYQYSNTPVVADFSHSPIRLWLLHDVKNNWRFQPDIRLLLPLIPSLVDNLGAIEIQMNSQADSKSIVRQPLKAKPSYRQDGSFVASTTINELAFTSLLENIDIGAQKGQKLSNIQGKLLLRLPQSIKTLELPLPGFYQPAVAEGVQIKLRLIDADFIARISYSVSGKIEKFINLLQVTKSGEKIFPAQLSFADGQWSIQFDLRDDIDHLQLMLADKQEIIDIPFALKAKYSDSP
ncbi:MAG: hypothetical protein KZQ58_06710 [gamma proteobacterium symbiont of Bathyaustriella thionipta]|nr:hypothetical protein [gamma proteobacterium symbiont of Bathyaustriella thionipta]